MNHQSLGGAIYLSNVDDYAGLSQSCINPIFVSKDPHRNTDELPSSDSHSTTNILRPSIQQRTSSGVRSRRSRPLSATTSTTLTKTTDSGVTPAHSIHPAESNNAINEHVVTSTKNSKISDVVTATIADCLACSGCITTAETILLQEQHSLDTLKEHLFVSYQTNRLTGVDDAFIPSIEECAPKHRPTVLTISPASLADLCRYLLYPDLHDSKHEEPSTTQPPQSSTQQKEQLLLQLTTILYRYLNVSAVMDGTVTLHTTLHVAAEEFCQTFHTNNSNQQQKDVSVPKDEVYEQQLMPSVAVSSQKTQYWIPPSINGKNQIKSTTTVEVVDRSKCTTRVQQSLPILSSSCPAIVCLVEKSYPAMVSHLSTTISPMIAAAHQFWNPVVPILINEHDIDKSGTTQKHVEFYHLAVMPCHDKKLEASRNDFRVPQSLHDGSITSSTRPIVDMVITTMELIQLLYDAITSRKEDDAATSTEQSKSTITSNSMYDVVRQTILSVLIAPKDTNESNMPIIIDCTALVTCLFRRVTKNAFEEILQHQVRDHVDRDRPYLFSMTKIQTSFDAVATSTASTLSQLNVTGSGGYADYIFRYAAKQIFGLDCPYNSSIWIPIVDEESMHQRHGSYPKTTGNRTQDVMLPRRMSVRMASHRKQREYYEAIIFQNNNTHQHYVATSVTSSCAMRNDSTIVLRFVIAYGMSLVQSVLTKLTRTEDGVTAQRYDYIECMACAHSCLNGNGQIRSNSSDTVVARETPSDIKLRVQMTLTYFPIQQHHHVTASETDIKGDSNGDIMITTSDDLYHNDPSFYTRYHIVPPMQHTMGVAAGIAVQDTQW